MIILIWNFHTFWPECQLHFEPDAIGEIFSDWYPYNIIKGAVHTLQ